MNRQSARGAGHFTRRSLLGAAAALAGTTACGGARPLLRPSDGARAGRVALTWWGTATTQIDLGGARLLCDPALDPANSQYDFGPWYAPAAWFASTKTYDLGDRALPQPVDAVLVSHDHHADNLDYRGREFLVSDEVKRVITPSPAADRLKQALPRHGGKSAPLDGLGIGPKLTGLDWYESTELKTEHGPLRISASPAKHGPSGTPRIYEVCGFVVEGQGIPTVWVSGDTVLFDDLDRFLSAWRGGVDVAVVHCGGVRFPDVPVIGDERFTFDGAEAIAALEVLDPAHVLMVHHSGWTHFRQPLAELKSVVATSRFAARTRWPSLGEVVTFDVA